MIVLSDQRAAIRFVCCNVINLKKPVAMSNLQRVYFLALDFLIEIY